MLRRAIFSSLLALMLVVSLITPMQALSGWAYAGSGMSPQSRQEKSTYPPDAGDVGEGPEETPEPGPEENPEETPEPGLEEVRPRLGVDVSAWQGEIDWEALAEEIDFAILRCGYGSDDPEQDDSRWEEYASACERLGIPYGVYLYSYATTQEQALSEARHVLRLLQGHSPSLPIYLDQEDPGTVATLSDEEILLHTSLFCQELAKAGYTPGVYASLSWWETRLCAPEYDQWSRWIAYWSETPPPQEPVYQAWQFTNQGTLPGIAGPVDLNHWYGALPESPQAPSCDGGEACPSRSFADVPAPANWAHEGIDYCLKAGLMKGLSESVFLPNGRVTRAQFVTILYRAAGSPEVAAPPDFADVAPDLWCSDAIAWASSEGLVNGVGEGCFRPWGAVTREQMAAILYRCNERPETEEGTPDFPDWAQVSPYARQALCWASQQGYIKGLAQNGTVYLYPQAGATRAQIASMMQRYLQSPEEEEGEVA